MDGITSSFRWAPKPPRIGLKVLQEPWGRGSNLAVLAEISTSQMVFAHRWLTSDDVDSATVLEVAQLGSYESLRLAIYRVPKSDLPLTL